MAPPRPNSTHWHSRSLTVDPRSPGHGYQYPTFNVTVDHIYLSRFYIRSENWMSTLFQKKKDFRKTSKNSGKKNWKQIVGNVHGPMGTGLWDVRDQAYMVYMYTI